MDRFLTSRIDRGSSTMGLRSILTKTFCCCCGRRLGNYLAILFVFSKLLYIANVIGQLFILNSVLKTTYNIFGFEFMDNIQTEDGYWVNSPIFPRVTMCDFRVRRLGKFLGNGVISPSISLWLIIWCRMHHRHQYKNWYCLCSTSKSCTRWIWKLVVLTDRHK